MEWVGGGLAGGGQGGVVGGTQEVQGEMGVEALLRGMDPPGI